jgi:hypothetical protein
VTKTQGETAVAVNYLAIYYIAAVLLIFFTVSFGTCLVIPKGTDTKQRLKSGLSLCTQMTVCSMGYCVFFFVLMLAIGIAVWLVLLGLVYLPADALNNVFGDRWTQNVVGNVMPYVSRSGSSPGLFRQPILDYATLSTLFFAPMAAIFSTIVSYKRRQSSSGDSMEKFAFRKNSA